MDRASDIKQRIAALSPRQQELLLRRLATAGPAKAGPAQPPIERRPVSRAPLSFAQQRLWFIDQLDPGTPHYNVAIAAPVHGPVDGAVLQRALDQLVGRHEALRTTFELDDETPVQVIHERMPVPLEGLDVGQTPTAVREAVADFSRRPYRLDTGPLVRVALVGAGPGEHVLAIAMHHIISDAWSVEIMLRELSVLYQATLAGAPVPLPPPALQYADFALWQRDWLRGEVLDRQLDYWRRQLSGDLVPLELPTDRPRPAQQHFQGAQHVHHLPADVTRRLNQLSATERTTPFTVFLTAIGTLLHRYSGQTDIVIGAPVSNRARAELEGTVGYLGNTLALRLDLSGRPTFREAVRRTHQTVFDAFANQDLPFERVVEIAQPERDLSRTPLLQVVFVYHMDDERTASADRMAGIGEPLAIDNGTTKFDVTFGLQHSADASRLALEYSTELFDAATIERLAGHWERLLSAVVEDPDRPIGRLPLLTDDERRTLLVDWNDTYTPFPEHQCLHELVEAQAARTPDAVAATDRNGSLTYADLDRRATDLAGRLAALGAGPEVPVAVCLPKSVDVAVALLGILKSGHAYLPLDPAAPPARMTQLLTGAGVGAVVTGAELADRFAGQPVHVVRVDEPGASSPGRGDRARPDHLAYVIYTSGSTGVPKGVMLDHRGRVNNFHDFNTRFGIGAGDRILALAALTFDMSAYDVLGTLMAGGRIVFPDPGAERDPAHWAERLRRERVTIWHSVPALLEMLVEFLESDGDATLPDLRLVLLGGDWIPPTLPGRLKAIAPAARVISLGGATEVSMDSTIYEVHEVDPAARSIPYGKPMANQRAYLLDAELQPVPLGVTGDLYLAGVGVGRGYLGDPELTARKFLDSPFPEEPGRLYRTGDLAKLRPDGNLELLGRADFQIKIRGWRIEPAEVQYVLRAHPAVREAAVVAHSGPTGARRLVAYVVAEPGAAFTVEDLHEWTRERLPDYMVPSAVLVVERFPLNRNGKLDLRSLPAPETAEAEGPARVAPRTPVERELAEVWCELLGTDDIGIDDNFFALGGDSIKTIQAIARAKKRGLRLTPRQLFQHQTIREIAAVAQPLTGAADPGYDRPILDAETLATLRARHEDLEDAYPLPPMQRLMYDNAVNRPVDGLYVIQADYLFTGGGLDPELMVRAWQCVIDRYPVLRTSFHADGLDEPVQVVHRRASVEVVRHDLRGLPVEEQVRFQDDLVAADRRRGYDLTRAPLVRIYLLRLDGDAYKYLSSNHHIVLDGWSRAIVQQEVFAVYEALRSGVEPELPPFRPFRDFVGWADRQDLSAAEAAWRKHLDGFTERTPLVAARGRPGAPAAGPYAGPFAKQSVPLPPPIAGRLDAFARAHQLTANTVMQAAWSLLMARYTGRPDVVLGVMSSGRATELADIDTVVGLCVNALPVRTRFAPDEPTLALLARLQREQVELREFEYTPRDRFTGWFGLDDPPFECLMVYENYPWDGSLAALADRVTFDHPLCQRDYQLAQFEFPLRVEVAPVVPLLIMHYYRDVFDDDVVTGMLDDWSAMIDRLVADADRPLGALLSTDPIRPEGDRDDGHRH